MKGIVLAGRIHLFPVISVFSKQLLPFFEKPTTYNLLSTLMLVGIPRHSYHLAPKGSSLFERS